MMIKTNAKPVAMALIKNMTARQPIVPKRENMDLNSSGIGNVSIHCEDELSLIVSGIGKVSYTGNPRLVHEDVSGIAKVSRN
jgi:hypothetical protein